MSDTGPMPGPGAGFPTFFTGPAPDAAAPPQQQPHHAQPVPPVQPLTQPPPAPLPPPMSPEARREELQRIMHSREYTSPHEWERGPAVRRVAELLREEHPADGPRDEITGMLLRPPPEAPPMRPAEIERKLSERMWFPPEVSVADQGLFLAAARDGLVALSVTHAQAGHFVLALNDAMRAPESLTPEMAEARMRAEWGSTYDAKLKAAQEAAKRLPAHVRSLLTETALGNSQAVLRLLAEAGSRKWR